MNSQNALRWAIALGFMAAIHVTTATGALEPSSPLPLQPPGVDKIVHACEFGVLAWLLWRPWREGFTLWPARKTATFIFILTALNGTVDELHQIFLPHKTASWGDIAADVTGGGIVVLWLLHREKSRLHAATPT